MSNNANYEKYYKNALKKFTEITNESNSTTTAPMSLSKHKSITKMKATYPSFSPVQKNLDQQRLHSLTKQNSSMNNNSNSISSQQTNNSHINQLDYNSNMNRPYWPEETDGWVYIKNLDDSKADFDAVDIKVEDYHCIYCKCAECTLSEIDAPNITIFNHTNHTTFASTSTQAFTKKLNDAKFEDDDMYLIL
ncbi:35418_t:CDS:2 [Racocetra persica]|uniref:35418_t:CDS:1 n=1 Tax=Racocetra persica TaxID=160502 RepID=A0ACA9P2A4_9GLOM|nr:35418_t:CDS:2 [Racocetra persica]